MKINLSCLTFLVLSLALSFSPSSAAWFGFDFDFDFDPEKILIDLDLALIKDDNKPAPIDWIFQDFMPSLLGIKPANENGTDSRFKTYAMRDKSNDDYYRLSITELISQAGFLYEVHDCIADDGYVTGLYRVVNPRAERTKLRYPPIIMEHGGTIDPTAYFIASTKQHHPEPWPRTHEDGPFTSWNRSLGFTLANHGFDVWLAETRGANEKFKRKIKGMAAKTILAGENEGKNLTTGENIRELFNDDDYWSFTLDDIIAHELKSHIDCVLKLTGAHQVHLLTFSLSTPTSLAFLSIRPDYVDKIRGYISMSPIISGDDLGPILKVILNGICPMLPNRIGTLVLTDILLKQPTRELFVTLAKSKYGRYLIFKALINLLFGPSAKYTTLLELNLLGHLLQQVGFKQVKQLCQQTRANQLQKFDFGPFKNKLIYNATKPPLYDLSKITMKDWVVVSGTNDDIATLKQVKRLYGMLNPENRPVAHIVAPGFNHLDMIGAVETDIYVNLPIVEYLSEMSDGYSSGGEDEHEYGHGHHSSGSRSLDLSRLITQGFKIGGIEETISNITTGFKPDLLMGSLQKTIMDIIKQLSGSMSFIPKKDEDTSSKTSDGLLYANLTSPSN